jgi:predicted RNase H-like nuclease
VRVIAAQTDPSRWTAIGVDGCRAGWAAVGVRADGRLAGCAVYSALDELWTAHAPRAARILIDVPIGLPRAQRACDSAAKAILGRYNARVFLTPPRPAVYAGDYAEAARLTRTLRGQGLSKQTWNIVPKIREADALLRASLEARAVIRECHPEICFWAMTPGGRVVAENKRTPPGAATRARLLRARFGGRSDFDTALTEMMAAVRGRAGLDDLLDAAAAAWCAAGRSTDLRTLQRPGDRQPAGPAAEREVDIDDQGLPVEIVYRV